MDREIPTITSEGDTRKIGFELEFAGLGLDEAAEIIQSLYGGKITKTHRYHYQIAETQLGTFRVELDARILRKMAGDKTLEKWGLDFKDEQGNFTIGEIVDRVAKTVVPIEVVMPPIPMKETEKLEPLRAALQEHKAEGTGASLVHAFGMHINIECPDLQAETLLRYLRAFVLLYPWLLKQLKIDMTRKITPFVDAFPEKYVKLILDPLYQPAADKFMDDYLLHNPTRNRPLDLMPVFAMEAPEKVQAVLEDEKNRPRPTFHYRLPNSHIDDADWWLADELEYWMVIERFAAMPEMVNKLSRLYLLRKRSTLVSFRKEWVKITAILLDLDE